MQTIADINRIPCDYKCDSRLMHFSQNSSAFGDVRRVMVRDEIERAATFKFDDKVTLACVAASVLLTKCSLPMPRFRQTSERKYGRPCGTTSQ
jgi:hypothetical protein